MDGATSAGGATLNVADITGFTNGKYIGVILDDGSQHQTTINGVPAGTSIVMTDVIPVGRSAPNAAAVVEAVELSGSAAIPVHMVSWPPDDWVVFTNGVDVPQRWDGTDCTDIPGLSALTLTTARTVSVFKYQIHLGNVTEAGVGYPQRIRYCAIGGPSTWNSGTAGFADLWDTDDPILRLALLGGKQIIYRGHAIVRQEYLGTAANLYGYYPITVGIGIIGTLALSNSGPVHVFMDAENVYEFDGNAVTAIGDPIATGLLIDGGDITPEQRGRTCALHLHTLNEDWFIVPTAGESVPNVLYRYSRRYKSWSTRAFANKISAIGEYARDTSLTWVAAPGTWTDYAYPWGYTGLLTNATTALLCIGDGTSVVEYDVITPTDNGTGIAYTVATKDFSVPDAKIRFDSVEVLASGGAFVIQYSIDGGSSYTTLGTASASIERTPQRFYKQFVAERFRLKITGTASGFQLGWLRVRFRPESLY